jgi:transcriptional regulator with XRE-family HTH domain
MFWRSQDLHSAIDQLYAEVARLQQPPQAQPLRALRRLRQLDVAKRMRISQSAVSQLEYLAAIDERTLRAYAEACGGTLELVARSADGQLVPLAVEVYWTSGVRQKPWSRPKPAP